MLRSEASPAVAGVNKPRKGQSAHGAGPVNVRRAARVGAEARGGEVGLVELVLHFEVELIKIAVMPSSA
jgi:hypothetical protein